MARALSIGPVRYLMQIPGSAGCPRREPLKERLRVEAIAGRPAEEARSSRTRTWDIHTLSIPSHLQPAE